MVNLTSLVESLVVAHNQPPLVSLSPHATQPQQTTVTYEVSSVPISATPVTSAQYCMPQGYPWGMPENFMLEGYNPAAQVALFVQTAAISAPPVVHTTPVANNEIHHVAPPTQNVMPVINGEVYIPAPPPSESLGF